MALDSKLTQHINLRANGDQLLGPMQAFGREINKVIEQLNGLSSTMTKGGHKSEDSLRAQVQLLQRLVGEASTLSNVLSSAGNRKRDGLFAGLEEQSIGRKAMSASKLKRELQDTGKASDALEVRLAQLYKRFGQMATDGRKVTAREISKAFNTEDAVKQVRRLEQELDRLYAKDRVSGRGQSPEATALRNKIADAQGRMLSNVKTPSRVNWQNDIAGIELLVANYRKLTVAENEAASAADRAAKARRVSALSNVNQSDAMLRASLERGASRYRYNDAQARGFNMPVLGRQIDENIVRLGRLRDMMSKALEQGRGQATIDRLGRSWHDLTNGISDAIAKQRAFNALPEQRAARTRQNVSEAMFGDGGVALGRRMLGAAALGTVAFGAINAVKDSARYVIEFEDALKGLQAIAGATNPEMQELSKSILDIAAGTKFSAVEITKSATAIAQAGFSAGETAGVLKDALTLATASGSSPTEAVDTLTSTLGAFNLQASESTHVVDVMVEGLNRSKLSINQMQAAIQYAGATAHESGVGFEELTAIAASLANAGIRSGSTIGTGLRQMLVDMKNPTADFKKELTSLGLTMADVDVKSKGFANVVKTLVDAGFSAEQAYASFEVRAASSFLAFKGQLDSYDEVALALTHTGAAAEAQSVAMDSLSAKWQQFLNIMGGAVTVIAKPIVDALKAALDAANYVGLAIGQIASALTVSGDGVGKFGEIFTSVFEVGLIGFFVGGPWGAVIGGVLALAGALDNTSDALERVKAASNKAEQEFTSQKQTVSAVDEAIDGLVTRSTTLTKNQAALQAETLNLTSKFSGLSEELQGVALNYDNVLAAMKRMRAGELRLEAQKAEASGLTAQDEQRVLLGELNRNKGTVFARAGQVDQTTANRATALAGRDFNSRGSRDEGIALQTDLQAEINRLRRVKDASQATKDLIAALEERLSLVQQAQQKQEAIRSAGRSRAMAQELVTEGAQGRNDAVLRTRRGVDTGLTANQQKTGSGEAALTALVASTNVQIAGLQKQQEEARKAGNTARFKDIERTIIALRAELARIERARRVAKEEEDKANRGKGGDRNAKPGTNLTGEQMKARLEKNFPGIQISSYKQRMPGNRAYKAGSLHARPGSNAIDITRLPKGVTPDNIRAFIQSQGVDVPNNANGYLNEFTNPSPHATGGHYHFGWKPKASSDAVKENTDIQQLQQQRATFSVSEQNKKIVALINEAKAGTRSVPEMLKELDKAFLDYKNARLEAFDVGHPTEGMSGALLEARTEARAQLEVSIREETRNWYANFSRYILDTAKEVLSTALDASSRELKNDTIANEQPVLKAQNRVATVSNYRNRSQFGVGAAYRMQREATQAEDTRDQENIDVSSRDITRRQAAMTVFEGGMKADVASGLITEGSPEWLDRQEVIKAKNQEIAESINARDAAQAALNARTLEFINIPLGDRLKESVAAWAENSGAMDDWSKTLENSIGPALDMFTSQLASMFQSISDGSFTVKQAFEDFTTAFTKMVMQIITKALALMAVKAILGAFGLQLNDGAGGTTIGKKAPGQMTGGPAGKPRKFMGGGTPQRGYISEGVSNRDTVPALLARKEYVVRGASVDSLGLPFMDAINQHGSKALEKMSSVKPMAMGGGRNETNVWVVKPEEQPQLGPNDIKLVIADDILQGGQTKQLIKRVIQGG